MMEIKKIEDKDLSDVLKVHKDSFKNFFLTKLGDEFLNIYYKSVKNDDHGILLGIFDEDKLCGFCAGTTFSRGFNKRLILNNFFRFSIVGFWLLLSKPTSLIRLLKNLTKNDSSMLDSGKYAELLSIAVSENKQGKGIGKKLLLELENEMKLKGCFKLSLTTDFYNNIKVIEFYKGLGYNIYYEFIAYPNRKMYRMIKDLQE